MLLAMTIFQACLITRVDMEREYKKNTNIIEKQETIKTDKAIPENKSIIKKPSLFEQIVTKPGEVAKSIKNAPIFPNLVEFETRVSGGDGKPFFCENLSTQKNRFLFTRYDNKTNSLF